MSLTDLLRTPLRTPPALTRIGVVRVVVGVWLAIHTTVVAAAPIADARLGHAERVVAHWEDAQDTSCPPLHDPATCQLCSQVSAAFAHAAADRVAPIEVVRAAAVCAPEPGHGAPRDLRPGAASPRGPPTV